MRRRREAKRRSKTIDSWPSWLPNPVAKRRPHLRRPVSVLVVDDDPQTRDTISSILRTAGYSVETARDGKEALLLLRSLRPAVIFLDVRMPIMNGPEFRQAQRRDRSLLEIPTIVMTADRSIEPMLDLAVEQTVVKPIKREELLAIVKRHCGPRRS